MQWVLLQPPVELQTGQRGHTSVVVISCHIVCSISQSDISSRQGAGEAAAKMWGDQDAAAEQQPGPLTMCTRLAHSGCITSTMALPGRMKKPAQGRSQQRWALHRALQLSPSVQWAHHWPGWHRGYQ